MLTVLAWIIVVIGLLWIAGAFGELVGKLIGLVIVLSLLFWAVNHLTDGWLYHLFF